MAQSVTKQRTVVWRWRLALARHWLQSVRQHLAGVVMKLQRALPAAALALALSGGTLPLVQAAPTATIIVASGASGITGGDGCSFAEAIINANNDAATHAECVAGSGADTIQLPANATATYTVALGLDPVNGNSALPQITSSMTIEGNGSTVQRDVGATTPFRLLTILNQSVVTVNDLGLSHGEASVGSGPLGERGGAIAIDDCSVTLNNSQLTYNRARNGGGLYANRGLTVLDESLISSNRAVDGKGGGIGVSSYASLVVSKSHVTDNIATQRGGGISTDGFANVDIFDSTISGNSAGNSGGGLSARGSIASIINNTFSGNTAEYGGGLYIDNGNVEIVHTTFSQNSAVKGGGIGNTLPFRANNSSSQGEQLLHPDGGDPSVTMTNSLLSGNSATEGAELMVYNSSAVFTTSGNLFGHDGASGVVGMTPSATDIIPTEPVAAILNPTLANNGGPTETHALVAGSPAVDAVVSTIATDQRGIARPQDGDSVPSANEFDIGAFELQSVPTAVTLGVINADPQSPMLPALLLGAVGLAGAALQRLRRR